MYQSRLRRWFRLAESGKRRYFLAIAVFIGTKASLYRPARGNRVCNPLCWGLEESTRSLGLPDLFLKRRSIGSIRRVEQGKAVALLGHKVSQKGSSFVRKHPICQRLGPCHVGVWQLSWIRFDHGLLRGNDRRCRRERVNGGTSVPARTTG